MQTSKPYINRLPHLDLLRFIASAAIILHHSLEFFFQEPERTINGARTMGLALFVDLFFVISGFVIAYVYDNRIDSVRTFGTFVQRRIARLIPLHWLILVIAMVIYTGLYIIGKGTNHPPSFRPACVAESFFILYSVMDCGDYVFNSMSWSISAEFVMYLSFPLYMIVGRASRAALLLLVCACFVIAIANNGTEILLSNVAWTKQQPLYRSFPSFIFGVWLCHKRPLVALLPYARVTLAAGTVITIILMMNNAPAYVTLAAAYVVVIAAIAADERGAVSPWLMKASWLGQLTYSMYMVHGLLIMVLLNALGDKMLHLSALPMAALAVVCCSCVMVMSYVSFIYFETPIRRKIDTLKIF